MRSFRLHIMPLSVAVEKGAQPIASATAISRFALHDDAAETPRRKSLAQRPACRARQSSRPSPLAPTTSKASRFPDHATVRPNMELFRSPAVKLGCDKQKRSAFGAGAMAAAPGCGWLTWPVIGQRRNSYALDTQISPHAVCCLCLGDRRGKLCSGRARGRPWPSGTFDSGRGNIARRRAAHRKSLVVSSSLVAPSLLASLALLASLVREERPVPSTGLLFPNSPQWPSRLSSPSPQTPRLPDRATGVPGIFLHPTARGSAGAARCLSRQAGRF